MVTPRPDEIRRTLAERVNRRVQGHGISRASVDDAVDKVLQSLGAAGANPASEAGDSSRASTPVSSNAKSGARQVLVALSARSVPDLASRVRTALAKDGITVGAIGTAMAGNHNVVTYSLDESARPAIERVATSLTASLTFVAEDGTR
jgi:hypothetical protein